MQDAFSAQLLIEQRIVTALVESTPEHWAAIALAVDVRWDRDRGVTTIAITSTEGHDDAVVATPALVDAVDELVGLQLAHGSKLARYVGTARDDGGGWQFQADSIYA